jgi:hypothetical protein
MQADGRPKLDFLIAGAQKGGTCTLDAIFRKHPQIQMARRKETHFFDDESRNWDVPDYARLHSYFRASGQRLRGEATPITLYWRPAIRRAREYNPDLKLILLLRNPVERAFSQWRQVYSNGRDPMLFSQAIREGRERVQSEGEVEGLHRYFSYIDRSLYGRQLAYLLDHFPRQQIHCEISEEFFGDQAATLQRVASFLGIDPFPALAPMHKNPGRNFGASTLPEDDIAYLAGLFREDIPAVEAFLGRPIPGWDSALLQAKAKSQRDQPRLRSGATRGYSPFSLHRLRQAIAKGWNRYRTF